VIHVDFDPGKLTGPDRVWWDAWAVKASQATVVCLDEVNKGNPPKFNEGVWSDLKAFLLKRVFNGKCAYCESRVVDTSFGDAEHFRPKGAVMVVEGGKRTSARCNGADHPGYYWLAHDWRNLIPACQECNTMGKANFFPLSRPYVCSPNAALSPAALDALEQPLLLHPYRDKPERHLQFGVKGSVAPKGGGVRGKESIKIYNLKRGGLVATRQEYQEKAWNEFTLAFRDGPAALRRVMTKWGSGKPPHSMAAVQYVNLRKRKYQEVFAY